MNQHRLATAVTYPSPAKPAAQMARMDRMYRLQRHVYDFTRRYYLLGRDRALELLDPQPGELILEAGCGTARNLVHLVRRRPVASYFGLDASQAMLRTAESNLARVHGGSRVRLAPCLAEDLDYRRTYGLERPFDAVLFSYALSMIPTWSEALQTALQNLRPGGRLCVVDFWDQGELPRGFAWLLKRWLALFGVHFRPELLDHLRALADTGEVELQLHSIWRRYAYVAILYKTDVPKRVQQAPALVRPAPLPAHDTVAR